MTKHQGCAGLQSDRWIGSELARCNFKDERHANRLRKLLEQLSDKIGGSIPLACQDWANTKAAYRFFSNDRVSEREILAGHFQSTRDRLAATDALILVLHDTTEFTFHRSEVGPVGIVNKSYMRKNKRGRPLHYTVCGILMHSSLAVTTEGLPLGPVSYTHLDVYKRQLLHQNIGSGREQNTELIGPEAGATGAVDLEVVQFLDVYKRQV